MSKLTQIAWSIAISAAITLALGALYLHALGAR